MKIIISAFFCLFFLSSFGQKENLSGLIKLRKGYKTLAYPGLNAVPNSFSIIDPGFPIVPIMGGLYLAGFNSWFLRPQRPLIVGAAQTKNDRDSSLVALKVDVIKKKVLLQKISSLYRIDSVSSFVDMPYGVYDLKPFDYNCLYLWGVDNDGLSHVWRSDFRELKPVFNTGKYITDADILTRDNVLMSIDSSVVLVGLKQAPKEIIKLDMAIESLTIDADGSLFLSTLKGIVHFSSLDKDDFDVITTVIHGKIRIYRNRLFVLWREKNEIVEIKLR